MKITTLMRKLNRKVKTVRMKPDAEGNVRVLEVFYDNLKHTKHPPAWLIELEEQLSDVPPSDHVA